MNNWQQLDTAEYTKFRNRLIPHSKSRGNDEQIDFLKQCKNRDSFLQTMERIPKTEGKQIPKLPDTMTEMEFKSPPRSREESIYQQWKGLTPFIASSSAFWAYVTIEHIQEGILEPSYLAGNGADGQTGQERIERALDAVGDDKKKRIDDCIRTIFRQLGGLPGVRGNRSVYVDCPLARSWWRQRLVSRAAERTGLNAEIIGLSIRKTKTHWEQIVSAMVSRNTVFGLDKVQDALMAGLVPIFDPLHEQYEEDDGRRTAKHVRNICQRLCFIGGSQEFGLCDIEELRAIVDDIVRNTP